MTGKPARILLVEDDSGDIVLIRDALAEAGFAHELEICMDGAAACTRLERAAADASSRPDLVILDLNLPRRDGREVYSAARKRPSLAGVPIIVFTTSSTDHDILAEDAKLDRYLSKPMRLEGMRELGRAVEEALVRATAAGA